MKLLSSNFLYGVQGLGVTNLVSMDEILKCGYSNETQLNKAIQLNSIVV